MACAASKTQKPPEWGAALSVQVEPHAAAFLDPGGGHRQRSGPLVTSGRRRGGGPVRQGGGPTRQGGGPVCLLALVSCRPAVVDLTEASGGG